MSVSSVLPVGLGVGLGVGVGAGEEVGAMLVAGVEAGEEQNIYVGQFNTQHEGHCRRK